MIPWGFWRPMAMHTEEFDWFAQEAPDLSLTDWFLWDRNKNPSGCREMEPAKHILGRIRSRDGLSFWAVTTWRRWVVRMSHWYTDQLAGNVKYSSKAIGTGKINMQVSEEWSPKPEREARWPSALRSASWDVNVFTEQFICSFGRHLLNSHYVPGTVLGTGDAKMNVRHSPCAWEISALWERLRQAVTPGGDCPATLAKCFEIGAESNQLCLRDSQRMSQRRWRDEPWIGFCTHIGSIAASTGWERMFQNEMAWGFCYNNFIA